MHILVRSVPIAAGLILAFAASPIQARDGAPPAGALEELRRAFTLGGAPVPPLVFRDLGDGNPADIKPMLVTVDAWAAIGSNQYAENVQKHQGWTSQTSTSSAGGTATETERYRYLGATPDGLMVAISVDATSQGTYAPATLHVLDGSLTKALDPDGKPYERVDVTTLAAYALGDGWTGNATLSGDTVTIGTEGGAAFSAEPSGNLRIIVVKRP